MIEDILETYKDKCTRVGQFSLVLDTWIILIITFVLGGIISLFIYKLLKNFLPELLIMYLVMAIIVMVEFIYLAIVQFYIFYKTKKYTIKIISTLLEEEPDKTIKNEANEMLKKIKKSKFKLKYIVKNNPIEKLYNKIKYKEFLDVLLINNQENAIKVKKNIKEYLNDKDNFKDNINTAFWGIAFIAILNPIIEYIQSIYIPNSSTEFNSINILVYLVLVATFILPAFLIDYLIRKSNDSKNRKEKRLLLTLSNKLTDYDFKVNPLKRYIQVELENDESN